MVRCIITTLLLCSFYAARPQWTRVTQLPPTDVFTLCQNGHTLYAGSYNLIYFSRDDGQTWDSTAFIPALPTVDAIAVHAGELYASGYAFGVMKSTDGGRTWIDIESGILPFISMFCEWKGNLYAATLGGSVYRLDSLTRNHWAPFDNGLSSLSANSNALAGTSRVLINGTIANRLYARLPAGGTLWDERFINGDNDVGDGAYDIIPAHDSLFIASHHTLFLSTDDGLSWRTVGSPLPATAMTLLNAREAVLMARNTFNGVNNTSFYYLKKDSLQRPAVPFSQRNDHFTYRMAIYGGKLWHASNHGLFSMPLSALPGITPADSMATPGGGPGSGGFTIGNVYPNPVPAQGHVLLHADAGGQLSAAIYDITGKRISTVAEQAPLAAGITVFDFSMGNAAAGVYVLKLLVNGKPVVRRFLHVAR